MKFNQSFIHEQNNSKKLLELFFMPIKIFFYEFILKISLKFVFFLNEVLAFKNNASDKCILTFSLDLTLCCELKNMKLILSLKF